MTEAASSPKSGEEIGESAGKAARVTLSGSQAKTAYAIERNARTLIDERGIEHCGFLTLTVGDETPEGFVQVWDAAEASRRINLLNRRVLPELCGRAIVVTERHKSGAIHFHLLAALNTEADIRTGFDHAAVKRGEYTSVSKPLRVLWRWLRRVLPRYGFGRAQLTPIRSTAEAISGYICKYLAKNVGARREEDAHKKLVRYLGWEKRQLRPNDFGWGTPRASNWRKNARMLAGLVGVESYEEVSHAFGPRWAWHLSQCMNVVAGDDISEIVAGDFARREVARALVSRRARRAWIAGRERRNRAGPLNWRISSKRTKAAENAGVLFPLRI